MLSESERRIRGQIGAHVKWARESDRAAATLPGRSASLKKLDERLAEEFGLDASAPDYAERLQHARKAHFGRLALASAKKRRKA